MSKRRTSYETYKETYETLKRGGAKRGSDEYDFMASDMLTLKEFEDAYEMAKDAGYKTDIAKTIARKQQKYSGKTKEYFRRQFGWTGTNKTGAELGAAIASMIDAGYNKADLLAKIGYKPDGHTKL